MGKTTSAQRVPVARRDLWADDAPRRRISQAWDWPWQRLSMQSLVSHAAGDDGCGVICDHPGPRCMHGRGSNPVEVPVPVPIAPGAADENVLGLAVVVVGGTSRCGLDGWWCEVCRRRFGCARWIDDGRQRCRGRPAALLLRYYRTGTQRNQPQQESHKPPPQTNRRSAPLVGAIRKLRSRPQ
jgi:hypothetical protein